MKRNKRIRAFTILEATINLTIMSIIVSIVYFTYIVFSKQLFLYSQQVEKKNQLNQLDLALKFDLHRSNDIVKGKNKISLLLNDNTTIEYEIIENKITRQRNFQKEYFETTIISHSFNQDIVSNGRLNYFTLNYAVFGDTIAVVYSKDFGVAKAVNESLTRK